MALRKPPVKNEGQAAPTNGGQAVPPQGTPGTSAQASQTQNLPATTDNGSNGTAVDFQNADGDVLVGFEALGGNGTLHYCKMDGTDWVLGGFDGEVREKSLDFIVSQARIYYYNRDTQEEIPYSPQIRKSPPGFALRSEVTYYDWVEGSDEPHEFRMTLPQNSTYRFKEYYEGLSKKGLRVNQSVTRATVNRKKNDAQQIFSEAAFAYVGPAETE